MIVLFGAYEGAPLLAGFHEQGLLLDSDPEVCLRWKWFAVGAEGRDQALVESCDELVSVSYQLFRHFGLCLAFSHGSHYVFEGLSPDAAFALSRAPKEHQFVFLQANGEREVELAARVDPRLTLSLEEVEIVDHFVMRDV